MKHEQSGYNPIPNPFINNQIKRSRSRSVSNDKMANYGQYISTVSTKNNPPSSPVNGIRNRSRRQRLTTQTFNTSNYMKINMDDYNKNFYDKFANKTVPILKIDKEKSDSSTSLAEPKFNEYDIDNIVHKEVSRSDRKTRFIPRRKSEEIKILKNEQVNKEQENTEDVSQYVVEKKVKEEFSNLEDCCKKLLTSTKGLYSKSYKDAYKFYNLLEGLYNSLHKINEQARVDCKKSNEEIRLTDTKDANNINGSNKALIEPKKMAKPRRKSATSSGDNANGYRNIYANSNGEKSLLQLKNQIAQSKPIISEYGKITLGEMLTLPKVDLKSKCIIGIHKDFVEEQYVFSTFRLITTSERAEMMNWYKILDEDVCLKKAISCKTITTGKVSISDNFDRTKYLIDECIQAGDDLGIHDKYKLREECDLDSLSWQTDNLSMDDTKGEANEMYVDVGHHKISNKYVEWSLTKEHNISDVQNWCEEVIVKSQLQGSSKCQQWSTWSIHGCKVKPVNLYQISFLPKPDLFESKNHSTRVFSQYYMDKRNSSTNNLTISENKTSALPPTGIKTKGTLSPSKYQKLSKLEMNCQEIKESLEQDIPLPENLSNLYERLSKLQKMLECIPEEKIVSTLDALDHLDESSIESLNHNQPLGDCNDMELIDNLKSKGVVEFSTKSPSPLKIPNNQQQHNHLYQQVDQNNSEINHSSPELDVEVQSDEATNSLSLLENLIDDFLLKNGLTNISNNN